MTKHFKLAILVSHPIQYQCPFFKMLVQEANIDLTVLFCSDWGLKTYHDEKFGQSFKWDIPLLDGYKYKFLKNISPLPNVSTFFGLINREIIDELKNNKYDVIWIHGWSNFTNWIAIITAFKLNIPILMRGETNLLQELALVKNFIKKLILKALFNKISGFLSIGIYNTQFYKAYGIPVKKIFFVPYTVNNEFFISKADELIPRKLELKEKYGIPKDLSVILFSGKLIDNKKPVDLLKAYEIVSKEIKAALVYAGDGELRDEMEHYIKTHNLKNVYLMGFKNQMELPEFYAIADIFVLPSRFEPWGLVVNEAMCFSLPVIVSDQVGAGGDLVKGEKNGYIFPAGDIKALSNFLKDLLKDETKQLKFGQNSKEIINKWSYKEDTIGIVNCLKNCNLNK